MGIEQTRLEGERGAGPERSTSTRRRFLGRAGVAAAAAGFAVGASRAQAGGRRPADHSVPPELVFTGTLRLSAVGVEWPRAVLDQAQRDLGFKLSLTTANTVDQLNDALAAPDSFDVFFGSSSQVLRLWPYGHLRRVDTRRIAAWPELYRLFTWGRLEPDTTTCPYGVGDAPFRSLFLRTGTRGLPLTSARPSGNREIVQWIDETSGRPYGEAPMPRYVVGAPAYLSIESMGYLSNVVPKYPSRVSWAELLNRRWRSRVALQADPAAALLDAANAVSALGLMRFRNVGSMTTREIDHLVKILTRYQKLGQFRAIWASFNDSVNLMASKDVAIAPLWPSAVARLAAEGIAVRYAVPPEGYRGSAAAVAIAAHVSGRAKLTACYALLNWLYAGFFGAALMRQGYYVGNGTTLRTWIEAYGRRVPLDGRALRTAEYDYWYRGDPATAGLPDLTGRLGTIEKGSVRDGGGLRARACRISCWSTYFHTAAYQVKRYDEFLSA
jgi:putative spermidine/putrescine transport system substrate-binding protein